MFFCHSSTVPGSKETTIVQGMDRVQGTGVIADANIRPRFTVPPKVDGYQKLVIAGVTLEDAGRYTCTEKGGESDAEWASAELVVTGNNKATTAVG